MRQFYELEKEILDLLDKADIPKEYFIVEPGAAHWEGEYFKTIGHSYVFYYFERGDETILCCTESFEELIYKIFEHIVSQYSHDYELKNRKPFQDFRRIWFNKEKEIMSNISSDYYQRVNERIENILMESPYNDDLIIKFDCVDIFRENIPKIKTLRLRLFRKKTFSRLKKVIVMLNDSEIFRSDNYFSDVVNEISDIYTELTKMKIRIDNGVKNNLETAIKYASEIIARRQQL